MHSRPAGVPVSVEDVSSQPATPSAGSAVLIKGNAVRKVNSASPSSRATATVRVPSKGLAVAKVRASTPAETSLAQISDSAGSSKLRVPSNGPVTAKVRVPSAGPATAKVRVPSAGATARMAPSAVKVQGSSQAWVEPPELPALAPLEASPLPPTLPSAPKVPGSGSAIRVVSRSRPAPAPDPTPLAMQMQASPPSSPSRTSRPPRPKVSPAIGATGDGPDREAARRPVLRAVAVSREASKTREGSSAATVSTRRAETRPASRSEPSPG